MSEQPAWMDVVNQNIILLMAEAQISDQDIHIIGTDDLGLEINVNGQSYADIEDISDEDIQTLIQAAIEKGVNDSVSKAANIEYPRYSKRKLSKANLILTILTVLVFVVPQFYYAPPKFAVVISWVIYLTLAFSLSGISLGAKVGGSHKYKTLVMLVYGLLGGVIGIYLAYMLVRFLGDIRYQ